ncbi:MAG: hypothetical protein CFH06_00679 [Alphaproteobacteria bacterium MarineAlpha3_Bin5]|nr:rhomboid family intramembrane serine protease [Magnetovibrio sp.]PPR78735.1 MAG: hypothetical protein CFH06_00679 [Alphaproteobacteria bacterium MarineAlpha3_Bin5]
MIILPLSDNNPLRRIQRAYITLLILFLCIGVFVYQISLNDRQEMAFIHAFGAIPTVIFGVRELPPEITQIPGWATLISSIFLHGGAMHLAGNMLFLWVLGDNVEDELGHGYFMFFFLICGAVSALSHSLLDTSSVIPMVGASGAISGIIGAYLILHPKAPIKTLFWWFIIEIPAWLLLGLWALIQFFNALSPDGGSSAGIAWWAHIGGFATGAVLIFMFRKKDLVLFDQDKDSPYIQKPTITMRRGPWSSSR